MSAVFAPPGGRSTTGEPRNTPDTQAREVRYLLDNLATRSDPDRGIRVERIYYYQWREPDPTKARDEHDSGLMDPQALDDVGRPRARLAYSTLKARSNP
jgi:hypothetical protein